MKKKTPNILEFLEELDKKHGEGEFTQFLDIFSEHRIDVSSIKHLNDDTYFDQMGIKIGFRMIFHPSHSHQWILAALQNIPQPPS